MGLFHGFDAFGHHLDPQRLADIDDQVQARCSGRGNRVDQLTIDLEAMRIEPQQADDRGVSVPSSTSCRAHIAQGIDIPGDVINSSRKIDRGIRTDGAGLIFNSRRRDQAVVIKPPGDT